VVFKAEPSLEAVTMEEAATQAAKAATLAGAGPLTAYPVAQFQEGMSAALQRCSSPAALAASALDAHKPTILMQHYDPEWVHSLPPHIAAGVRPLRYSGISIRDPSMSTAEVPENTDLQFRIDIGPGSVTAAAAAAIPGRALH